MASLIVALGVVVALGPGAGAQTAVTADALVGVWQFHPPPCGSDNGMGLDADGTAWITETYSGTWRLDGTTLRFTMNEQELDFVNNRVVIVASNVAMAAELLKVQPNYLELRWGNGHIGHAWRCR